MDLRIGQGIDVHRFQENRKCILGGIEIPHARGLIGHSDADVIIHALMDAILGAAGNRDIGTLFPDTDPSYKDADSCELLREVWRKVSDDGWQLVNADITVLAEAPKLKPYIQQMRDKLSGALNVAASQVAIKATTMETMGFIGREEGILASVIVLLMR